MTNTFFMIPQLGEEKISSEKQLVTSDVAALLCGHKEAVATEEGGSDCQGDQMTITQPDGVPPHAQKEVITTGEEHFLSQNQTQDSLLNKVKGSLMGIEGTQCH